jgi:enolase
LPLTIDSLHALEILDSRGRPTLEVTATLSDGTAASAQVPSGASTGRHEALELRDRDPFRYGGYGVLKAAKNVDTEIGFLLKGVPAEDLSAVDRRLIECDGTRDKSRLGANAMLGASCAVARAVSAAQGRSLWRTLADIFRPPCQPAIPRPMVNILSGGLHAAHNIEVQDFLVVPLGFERFSDALHAIVKVHAAARELIVEQKMPLTGVADEGGWGPLFRSNESALQVLTQAIDRAGFRPAQDCAIAIDIAASHFYSEGLYHLRSEGRRFNTGELIDLLARWRREYPVISFEDALDQDDFAGWATLTQRLGADTQLIGDDLFTTNSDRVRRGMAENAANAVLVKMNQIGTLTETFEVVNLAASAGWRAVISARSGETEDSFLADLATAAGVGQIKVGSITRSERLAKYNRLLAIEQADRLPYAGAGPL